MSNNKVTGWAKPVVGGKYAIGIDTGVKTGIAIWDCDQKAFIEISTEKIHRAMDTVLSYHNIGGVFVKVEDARMATFGRSNDYYKAQGSGSVKRDASIWEAFLKDHKIPYNMCRPNKKLSKLSKEDFSKITKYTGLTSQHSRDAAMMVFGM